MPRYLISFDSGAMDHIPAADFPEVARASHAVVQEAKDAGVFVFGGGLDYDTMTPAVVGTDGSITEGPLADRERVGGMTLIDVPTREEALEWAGKLAAACRCPQDVREFMDDLEV